MVLLQLLLVLLMFAGPTVVHLLFSFCCCCSSCCCGDVNVDVGDKDSHFDVDVVMVHVAECSFGESSSGKSLIVGDLGFADGTVGTAVSTLNELRLLFTLDPFSFEGMLSLAIGTTVELTFKLRFVTGMTFCRGNITVFVFGVILLATGSTLALFPFGSFGDEAVMNKLSGGLEDLEVKYVMSWWCGNRSVVSFTADEDVIGIVGACLLLSSFGAGSILRGKEITCEIFFVLVSSITFLTGAATVSVLTSIFL